MDGGTTGDRGRTEAAVRRLHRKLRGVGGMGRNNGNEKSWN